MLRRGKGTLRQIGTSIIMDDGGSNQYTVQVGTGSGKTVILPTFAAATDTIVTNDSASSLTNKTLQSPSLVTPDLGTPTAGTLTNCTGLPVTTGISGLGTGVATFLATPSADNLRSAVTEDTGTGNLVFSTSPALVAPDLGTPTAITLTNGTGLPVSTGISGLGSGMATFLATPSSANLRATLTDETGTGSTVFSVSPTMTTPSLINPKINANGTLDTPVLDDGTIDIGGTNATTVNISRTGQTTVIKGDLQVDGDTTTVNTATLDVEDANITVNKNGNDASSEGSGLTVERTGTNGSIVYEDALQSKWKAGSLGSEIEIVNVSSAQTLTSKTLTSPDINGGTADSLTSLSVNDNGANDMVVASSDGAFTASRTFNVDLNDADRTVDLSANLTVEATSTLNQDLTTDATPTFAGAQMSAEVTFDQISEPSTPASGDVKLYFKSNNALYKKTADGTETPIEANPILGYAVNVYNTDTTDADDTTSFAAGNTGVALPTALTATRAKRVEFQSPILDTMKLAIEIDQGGNSHWVDAERVFPRVVDGADEYGVWVEYVSSTLVDVKFGGAGATSDGTQWNDASLSGYRWRLGRVESYNSIVQDNLTDWTGYTPGDVGGWTASSRTGVWKRSGDSMRIRAGFTVNTASGTLSWDVSDLLPSGHTMDESKLVGPVLTDRDAMGTWIAYDAASTTYSGVIQYDRSANTMYFAHESSAINGSTPIPAGASWGSGDTITIDIEVPITEFGGAQNSLVGFTTATSSIPGIITTVGPGMVPVGAIIPIASSLTGSYSIPSSGTVSNEGWMYCDGSTIPSGQALTGGGAQSVPNLTDGRFLRGSTSHGGTGTGSYTPTGSNNGGAASFNKNVMNTNQTAHNHGIAHTHAWAHETSSTLNSWSSSNSGRSPTDTANSAIIFGAGGASGSSIKGIIANNGDRWYTTGVSSPPAGSSGSGALSGSASVSWTSSIVNTSFTNPTFTGDSTTIEPKYLNVQYLIRVN